MEYYPTMPGAVSQNWIERYGAWIVSLFLHLSFFILLVILRPEAPPRNPRPEPIRLIFTEPEEMQIYEPEVVPKEETKLVEPEVVVSEPEIPPMPTIEEMFPDIREHEQQERDIADILSQADHAEEREALLAMRSEVDKRLRNIDIATKAVPHFPDYKGARVGAVRTLNLMHVDPQILEEVFKRYDISISRRFVETVGPSFLSSAATGTSIYHATDRPGYYEVFEISPKAHRHMIWLEQNYLISHGFDPKTARVDLVTFGVVQKLEGFWDLGIIDIKIQRFTPIGESTTTREDTF